MTKIKTRHYMDIVFFRVYAQLKIEASRGCLGILWWVLEPMLFMSAFYVVFALGLRGGGDGKEYAFFLLSGLLTWKWFASTINHGSGSIESNAGLMSQVYLPKYIFPLIVVVTNTFKFLIIISLFLCFLSLMSNKETVTWISLPALMVIQFIFIIAMTGISAAIVPIFPDLKLIIENGLLFMFFMSGIFFNVEDMSFQIKKYFYLNPMAVLIKNYRDVILDGGWPNWPSLLVILFFSILVIIISFYLLKRFDKIYPKIV